ncbi:MAG: ATP-binding protein [Elusimicrobia bacterium]|nr:ATP-binding protein [Elusimicrobiota bacterium]
MGKTTAIQVFLKSWPGPSFYNTADAVSPPDAAWIESRWQSARRAASASAKTLLVFDELQKIPRWSEAVKKCFDEDCLAQRPLAVVILGSSALLMQRGLTESLAGRFEVIPFPHWSRAETASCFGLSLDEFIFYGGYPGALRLLLDSGRDEARWAQFVRSALVETVLNRDILLLTPVTKPALFRQVFHLGVSHPARIFSLNKMLGQLQEAGNASTIASYLRLLDAAMLLKPLEKFSGNRLRQRTSSPKLIVLNNALINASGDAGFAETRRDPARWGRLIENAAGAALINNNMGKAVTVTYWRERDLEVDFVVQSGGKLLAIEVKSGREKGAAGLRAFLRRYPEARGVVVAPYGGDIPLEDFLSMDAPEIIARIG